MDLLSLHPGNRSVLDQAREGWEGEVVQGQRNISNVYAGGPFAAVY